MKGLLLAPAFLLASIGSVASAQSTQPATEKFRGDVIAVRRIDKNHLFLATAIGLYESTDDPSKWKSLFATAQTNSPPKGWIRLLGGGSDGEVFLAIDDGTQDSYQLAKYAQAQGLTPIRRIPKQAFDFATKMVGAFADGEKVQITLDGGKTWETVKIKPMVAEPWTKIGGVQWLSPTLLLAADNDQLVLIEINPAGTPQIKWSTKFQEDGISAALNGNRIWSTPYLRWVDLATGEVGPEIDTKISANGMAMQGQSIWLWGDSFPGGYGASICTVENDKAKETLFEMAPVWAIIPWGDNQALAVQVDGKLFWLKTTGGPPVKINCEIDNSVIDKEIAKAKAVAEAGKASLEEIKAMSRVATMAGEQAQQDLLRRLDNMKFSTESERVRWITEQLQTYIDQHKESPQTKPRSEGDLK